MNVRRLGKERSLLFVPGHRPDRFMKAHDSGADQVIIDLEDAVPPDLKDRARRALLDSLNPERPVLVRINAPETAWFGEDRVLAGLPGVAGLMLPKVERTDEIAALARMGTPVYALIETAAGYANAQAIATVAGVCRLVFGSIDFQLDLGIEGDGAELLAFVPD